MTSQETALIERNLGRVVLGLPAISASLGHQTVQDSLVYLHAQADRPELQLLYDIIAGENVDAMCDRYFGGVEEAQMAYHADAFRSAHATAHAHAAPPQEQG